MCSSRSSSELSRSHLQEGERTLNAFIQALVFGIVLAIAIGPIALIVIRAGLEKGFTAAARCGLGAATADLLYSWAAFTANTLVVPLLDAHRESIALTGAVVLVALGLYLAGTAIRSTRDPSSRENETVFGFSRTLSLTLVNPLSIVVFASFAPQVGATRELFDSTVLALAVFLGSLLVQLVLASFGALLRRMVSNRGVIAALNVASGLGIAGFGIHALVSAL